MRQGLFLVGGQVPGEFPQGLSAATGAAAVFGLLPGGFSRAVLGPLLELVHQCVIEPPGVRAGQPEHPDGHVVPLPQQARQQMFGAHIGAAASGGVLHGDFHHPAGPGGEALGRVAAGVSGSHAPADHLGNEVVGKAVLHQNLMGRSSRLTEEAQQQMFGAHIAVPQLAGGFLTEPQSLFRSGAEFPFAHIVLLPF